jgi:hypothetical protein
LADCGNSKVDLHVSNIFYIAYEINYKIVAYYDYTHFVKYEYNIYNVFFAYIPASYAKHSNVHTIDLNRYIFYS